MNAQTLREKLGSRDRRKLENNTYIRQEADGNIYVRLHTTDIIILSPDDTFTLNTGGWQTVTTKDRLNKYGPVRIYQDKGQWYIGTWNDPRAIFADGIRIDKRGKITGAIPLDNVKSIQKNREKIRKYATAYMDALRAGKIPVPSPGDCWYCYMQAQGENISLGEKTGDNSHIKAHIKEKYFVPSLLMNAVKTFPVSQACQSTLYGYMTGKKEYIWPSDYILDQAKKSLTRYLYRHLKLGA